MNASTVDNAICGANPSRSSIPFQWADWLPTDSCRAPRRLDRTKPAGVDELRWSGGRPFERHQRSKGTHVPENPAQLNPAGLGRSGCSGFGGATTTGGGGSTVGAGSTEAKRGASLTQPVRKRPANPRRLLRRNDTPTLCATEALTQVFPEESSF